MGVWVLWGGKRGAVLFSIVVEGTEYLMVGIRILS